MKIHTCPHCYHQWQHGHDGSHSCVARLEKQRDDLLASLETILDLEKDKMHGVSVRLPFTLEFQARDAINKAKHPDEPVPTTGT